MARRPMCLPNAEKTVLSWHECAMKLQGPIEARDRNIRFVPTGQKPLAFPGPPQCRIHGQRTSHQCLSIVIGLSQRRHCGTRRCHNRITVVESSSATREVVSETARRG